MAKISELSLLANPRGDERLPVIDQNGETRGANIGPLVNAAAGPALARADESATRSGQSAGSANLFASAAAVLSMLQPSVAAGIAATPNDRVFGILSGAQVALIRNDNGAAVDTGARFGTPEIHVETRIRSALTRLRPSVRRLTWLKPPAGGSLVRRSSNTRSMAQASVTGPQG
jgi:hypothetical protein